MLLGIITVLARRARALEEKSGSFRFRRERGTFSQADNSELVNKTERLSEN
jgi:hypothetical protein